MATIIPFRGYRPPSDSAHKISSPPYDVMSSDEARDMTRYNPDSFLRVIKPEIDFNPGEEPKDDDLHNHAKHNLLDYIEKLKIDILGKMHDATILDESPYDPENKLLRA